MARKIVTTDDEDDILISFLDSQERDQYCHEINLQRFTSMILSLPEGDMKKRYTALKAETQSRLDEVNAIIAATTSQLPSTARQAAAISRLLAKKAAGK